MSRFKSEIHFELIDGKVYWIDAALVPALHHVPPDILPPLLAALDREIRIRHTSWMKANKRASDWRVRWVDRAIPYLERGESYANIGRILESKGLGNKDRIARALARIVVRKNSM